MNRFATDLCTQACDRFRACTACFLDCSLSAGEPGQKACLLVRHFFWIFRLSQEQPQLIQEDHGARDTQVFNRNDKDNRIMTHGSRNAKWTPNMEIDRAVVVTVA